MKNINSMTYLIIGMILTGIGIGFTVIGTIKQGKEAQDFQFQVIESQKENIELSHKLTEISEEKFHQLTKPVMNVLRIEEVQNPNFKSRFRILAKNTGNNECLNAKLIIDKHNSPLVFGGEVQKFAKVPKDSVVAYSIPYFVASEFEVQTISDAEKNSFNEDFFKRYQKSEVSIVVFFHFEYEWNGELLKSSQFIMLKPHNQRLYFSSSEDYVEQD